VAEGSVYDVEKQAWDEARAKGIKGSRKGVAQGLLCRLSLFKGSVPSEQIKVCNWVPTRDCIKVEPLQDSASQQRTLDLIDLLKSRKFALREVTHSLYMSP